MLQWLGNILFGIIVLNMIIFVHELGHYFVSKLLGVDVQAISIGILFPLAFRTTKKNLIKVRLNFPPIGGYCKLKGSADLIKALSKNKNSFVDTTVGSIYSVHPLSRFAIYFAGPAFNFALTFILITIFYLMPYMADNSPARVVSYRSTELSDDKLVDDSQKFMNGDLILELNGKTIKTFPDAYNILKSAGKEKEKVNAVVQRNNEIMNITVAPRKDKDGNWVFSIAKKEELKIQRINHESPEYKAQLREGDEILKVNGEEVHNSIEFINLSEEAENIELRILREGEEIDIKYTPLKENGKTIYSFALDKPVKLTSGQGIIKSTRAAITDMKKMNLNIINLFRSVFRGEKKLSQTISGPLGAVKSSGELVNVGMNIGVGTAFRTMIYISAILSLSLGLFNLIPFPGLDGSLLVLSIIELFKRDKIMSPKFYGRFEIISFIAGILVVFIISISDLL